MIHISEMSVFPCAYSFPGVFHLHGKASYTLGPLFEENPRHCLPDQISAAARTLPVKANTPPVFCAAFTCVPGEPVPGALIGRRKSTLAVKQAA